MAFGIAGTGVIQTSVAHAADGQPRELIFCVHDWWDTAYMQFNGTNEYGAYVSSNLAYTVESDGGWKCASVEGWKWVGQVHVNLYNQNGNNGGWTASYDPWIAYLGESPTTTIWQN
jgi:hypothetical protein